WKRHQKRLPPYCLDLWKTFPDTFSVRHRFLCSLLAFLLHNGGLPPAAARDVVFTAASCLENGYDHLDLLSDPRAELVARFLNLGPNALADVRELGRLLVGQVQVLEVRDAMGHPVAHVLLALVLEFLELFLLRGRQHVPDLFRLFPYEGAQLLGSGRHFLLLVVREFDGFEDFLALLAGLQAFL